MTIVVVAAPGTIGAAVATTGKVTLAPVETMHASAVNVCGGPNMAHVLARLAGVQLADVRKQLAADASAHAEQGMYLEHLWTNANVPGEVLFLFRVENLDRCKQRIEKVHAEARRQNPNAKLPAMVFLSDG